VGPGRPLTKRSGELDLTLIAISTGFTSVGVQNSSPYTSNQAVTERSGTQYGIRLSTNRALCRGAPNRRRIVWGGTVTIGTQPQGLPLWGARAGHRQSSHPNARRLSVSPLQSRSTFGRIGRLRVSPQHSFPNPAWYGTAMLKQPPTADRNAPSPLPCCAHLACDMSSRYATRPFARTLRVAPRSPGL